MQHGRQLLRCRRAVRWVLGLLVLASLAAVLEAILPAQPRWVLREPLRPIAYSADDPVFVTAKFKQGDIFEEPCMGPLEIRALADGKVLASLFADAAEIKSLDAVPIYPNTLMLGVQARRGAPWETHLLDPSRMTTRKLKFTLQPDMAAHAYHSPKSPLTAILQFSTAENLGRQELRVVDLETGAVVRRWADGDEHIEPVMHERFLFYGHALSERWTVFCWDLQEQRVNVIEEGVHDVRVCADKRFAVTIQERREGRMRVKLWDLAAGAIVAESLTAAGSIGLSSDGQWGMIFPEPSVVAGKAGEFWNLRDARKIGAAPHDGNVDWWEVIAANGRPLLATHSSLQAELRVSDAETLEPIWRRPWPGTNPFASTFVPHRTRTGAIIALDNDAHLIDLSSGDTLHRLNLVGPHYRDGVFGHGFNRNGPLVLLANYTVFELTWVQVWRAKLGEWAQPEPIGGVVQMSMVIDPDAGKLLFQGKHHTDDHTYRCRLSKDARTMIISYGEPNNQRVIECWDVPARKPWRWIVGIPLALGAVVWLLRCGWLRWRSRSR
jgi:hypothetical protein